MMHVSVRLQSQACMPRPAAGYGNLIATNSQSANQAQHSVADRLLVNAIVLVLMEGVWIRFLRYQHKPNVEMTFIVPGALKR